MDLKYKIDIMGYRCKLKIFITDSIYTTVEWLFTEKDFIGINKLLDNIDTGIPLDKHYFETFCIWTQEKEITIRSCNRMCSLNTVNITFSYNEQNVDIIIKILREIVKR